MPSTERHQVSDILSELSYYSLYDISEKARWRMSDVPWEEIDESVVDARLIALVEGIAFGELTTYSATHSFMNLFEGDIDFTQWLAVWLYEETKHPHVLAKWLSLVGHPLSADFFRRGREITPMRSSRVEMLTFNIISEIVATTNYARTSKIMPEPVMKQILHHLAQDEMRHSQGFEHYCKLLIRDAEDPDKERLGCLRATWAFLHSEAAVAHPVFLADQGVPSIADDALVKKTQERIRVQVTRRISSVVDIPLPSPDSVYDVYREVKASYQKKRRQARTTSS